MYVIKDVETGNFLSSFSFQLIDEKENIWLYTTYTGLIGTKFYNTKENAQKALDDIEKYNIESGINRELCIAQVTPDGLPIGKRECKYIKNIREIINKPIDLAI